MSSAVHMDSGGGILEISKDFDTVWSIKMYGAAGKFTPSAATVTLINAAEVTVLNAVAATSIANGLVSYTFPTASLVAETLGDKWFAYLAITHDGLTYHHRRRAALVLVPMVVPMTEEALFAVGPDLEDAHPDKQTSWFKQITESWEQVRTKTWSAGVKPWKTLGADAWRSVAIWSAAELCYSILSEGAGGSRWQERLDGARVRLAAAWANLEVDIDEDDSGTPNADEDDLARFSENADPVGGNAGAAGRDW